MNCNFCVCNGEVYKISKKEENISCNVTKEKVEQLHTEIENFKIEMYREPSSYKKAIYRSIGV